MTLGPRTQPSVSHSSGDSDRTHPDLHTFYPLFPKGLYYGHIDNSGSLNAIVMYPQLVVQVAPTISLQTDTFMFWRQRITAGLYSQPGGLLRSGDTSRARFVGWLQDVEISWRAGLHTTVQLLATSYATGAFLKSSAWPGEDIAYVGLKLSYKF